MLSFKQSKYLTHRFVLIAATTLLFVASQVPETDATLFQNIARDMARNRVLHILRHYPNLLNEVIQQQQQMMQMQQQQEMQQQQQQQQPGLNNQQQNGMGGMNQPFGGNNNMNGGGASSMAVQASLVPNRPNLLPATNEGQLDTIRQGGRPLNSQFGIII